MPVHLLPLSFNGDNYSQLCYTLERFFEYALTLVRIERPEERQREKIKFCYIGTASRDSLIEDLFFISFAYAKFGPVNIGLTVSKLSLTTDLPPERIESHIRKQDVLFFGGGDTEFMLSNWKDKGFEAILKRLKDEDRLPVILGLSAGGIFPFQSAISLTDDNEEYKVLEPGYNWIPDGFCPHSNSTVEAACAFDNENKHNRMSAFETSIKLGKSPAGYAIPDDCMLHFHGEQLVGAYSARVGQDITYAYVTREGAEQKVTQFLTRENSGRQANDKLKAFKHDSNPTQEPIVHANQCVIL